MITKIEITGTDKDVVELIRAYITKELKDRQLNIYPMTENGRNELWIIGDQSDMWSIRNAMETY